MILNRTIKRKCDKCGIVSSHNIITASIVSGDIFTESIYEKGKLRWAGCKIGDIKYNENKVKCSSCWKEYTYSGKKIFYGNTELIEFLKNKNRFLLSVENKKIFDEIEINNKRGKIMMYIVTRHKGAVEWIKKHYPIFNNFIVMKHISAEQIKGSIVIGTLPVNLAVLAKEYWHLSMMIPLEMRGKELTIEDMEEFGCQIIKYKIEKMDQDTRKGCYQQ